MVGLSKLIFLLWHWTLLFCLLKGFGCIFQITKDKFQADSARDIFQYVSRDLSHPVGTALLICNFLGLVWIK